MAPLIRSSGRGGRTGTSAWVAEGVAAGASNLLVGWMVAGLLVLPLACGIDWAQNLERRGIDLAMRWAVAIYGPVTKGPVPT